MQEHCCLKPRLGNERLKLLSCFIAGADTPIPGSEHRCWSPGNVQTIEQNGEEWELRIFFRAAFHSLARAGTFALRYGTPAVTSMESLGYKGLYRLHQRGISTRAVQCTGK